MERFLNNLNIRVVKGYLKMTAIQEAIENGTDRVTYPFLKLEEGELAG